MNYECLTFIFCDALELLLVYFFSSRFVQPESEVSIANFWFPVFQFIVRVVPAVYRIVLNITRRVLRKRKEPKQNAKNNTDDVVSNISQCRNGELPGPVFSPLPRLPAGVLPALRPPYFLERRNK